MSHVGKIATSDQTTGADAKGRGAGGGSAPVSSSALRQLPAPSGEFRPQLPSADVSALTDFEHCVLAHDRQLQRAGLSIWVGAEPTFTDRFSEAPEWLCEALGPDKEQRARQLLAALRERCGGVVLRSVGRQYSAEAHPRWSYGLYRRRDGEPVWLGPADLLLEGGRVDAPLAALLPGLMSTLVQRLSAHGWSACQVCPEEEGCWRAVFRCDGRAPPAEVRVEPRLARASVHEQRIPAAGLVDDLAADGNYLLVARAVGTQGAALSQLSIELPAFPGVAEFLAFLRILAEAATRAGIPALCLCGFPPPVDASIAYSTLTPDPAVLEVNQAPAPDLVTLLGQNRELFALAAGVGLAPLRLQYNGRVSDSGGGGQLTLGGPTPEQSPFFVVPALLPRLVRYLLRHPSLSYWFATAHVGGSSQSPRPDEGLPESLYELGVALEQLACAPAPTPDLIWATLRHFLADFSGNPHRSELNVEKLHNPYLPGRGCLGLVEFRAFGMPASAERLASIAMLIRALVVMLSQRDVVPEVTSWGGVLHDQYALPSFLRQDLLEVQGDLARAGLALGAPVEACLLEASQRHLGTLELAGCRLDVEQALEFWPLIGDVASQDAGSSRLVDASTSRIEVRLSTGPEAALTLDDWQLSVNGYRLPLVRLSSAEREARLFGVRYLNFAPKLGLHPGMPAEQRIVLDLTHRVSGARARASLYDWSPDGRAYPGLPRNAEDAAQRRAQRFVVECPPAADSPAVQAPPPRALSAFCLDLRRARWGA